MSNLPPRRIARNSHYVPMAALRRWSDDGTHVFAYRILVSNPKVPEWTQKAIRGLAYRRDLYTAFAGGRELDDFEKWLAREFEQPGLEAIDKLLRGSRLSPADWRGMVRIVAAQDVRTPLNFIESIRRWEQQVPDMLERTVQESIKRLEEAKQNQVTVPMQREPNEYSNLLEVSIEPPVDLDSDQARIRAAVPIGRRLWIAAMRHLLTNTAETLSRHRWSVVEPDGDAEWPLTDHPVLRLNYYKPGHYDFGGGWANPGSEIMMPVSPRHLLYVQVGSKAANRFAASRERTQLVQRFLVERAHRWVFARRRTEWVVQVRPRTVDPERLAEEKQAWDGWHQDQLQSEMSSEHRRHFGDGEQAIVDNGVERG